MRHGILLVVAVLTWASARAQRIDSVQVFRSIPEGSYTSALANAMAWRLYRMHAPHRTVQGPELDAATEALKTYKAAPHRFRELPGLSHLAMAFSGGRPLAFGVANDMDLVIDFTARTEYRIGSMADHLRVRALLVKALLVQ